MNRGSRVVPLGLAGVVVLFLLTALLTGDAEFLIPVAIAGILWIAYAVFNAGLAKASEARSGGLDAIKEDHTNPIPSAHLADDSDRPLGDTSEAHDEISPHDLPKDNPGRPEAERQARFARDHTTVGDATPEEVRNRE